MTTKELLDEIDGISADITNGSTLSARSRLQALAVALRSQANICGDDLCWMDDATRAKPLPKAEMLESCNRYIDQITKERKGPLKVGQMTIAQLEKELMARIKSQRVK